MLKHTLSILLLFLIVIGLSSCSGYHARSTAVAYDYSEKNMLFDAEQQRLIPSTGQDGGQRVIHHFARLDLRVKEEEPIMDSIRTIADRVDGYVVTLSTTRSRIRVPQQQMQNTVDALAGLGKVMHTSYSGEDVTEEYIDLDARLSNARKARDRYLELLALAEDVTAALAVEKELERVNGDIEAMEGRMNKLTHLGEMATIDILVYERPKLGPLGYVFHGVWKGIRWLFVRD